MLTRLTPTLLALLFFFPIAQGQNFWKRQIVGQGDIVSQEVQVQKFDGIANGYSCNVHISQGKEHKVVMEGQQNILDNMEFTVKDGVLRIHYDRMVRRAQRVEIHITLPSLTLLKLSGSGNMTTETPFRDLNDLDLSVSGSGNLRLNVEADQIFSKVSGSGEIELQGMANELEIRISGSGNMDALDAKIDHCTASISGSGNARVQVNKSLTASVSGSGNIKYRGDHVQLDTKISGSGSVKSL